ncbi:histidine kinase [Mesorhizobium sp. A556]
MPTLFRFVVTLLVLAGIAYGAMFALVLFVEPNTAEISVRIPAAVLDPSTKPDPLTNSEPGE